MNDAPLASHRELTAFRPLASGDFRALEHAASLKGLLKPFKGKGELLQWSYDCARLRDALMDLAQRRVLDQATTYPFNALRVQLGRQKTSSGTVLLRWRAVDRSAMGVAIWAALVGDPRTPPALLPDLLGLEHQRVTLNMQISLVHTLSRHAEMCAGHMARADEAFLARTAHPQLTTLSQELP